MGFGIGRNSACARLSSATREDACRVTIRADTTGSDATGGDGTTGGATAGFAITFGTDRSIGAAVSDPLAGLGASALRCRRRTQSRMATRSDAAKIISMSFIPINQPYPTAAM